MEQQFAIITFRATGPIKTWSDMRGANAHNARTKPIEHAVPGAPEPEHLIGTGDLVADVKSCIRDAGIDPARLRKNGVIAYEAIMTASPAFFERGDHVERQARLRRWTAAQVDFAKRRWGSLRIPSMVLHLDEKTPHIHLVVVPIEMKSDGRRRDSARSHAGLVGRMISGPGKFDQLQTDYATAMATFGLVRGEAGSGRKNEPVPVYLARLAAKERDVDTERRRLAAAREVVEQQTRLLAIDMKALAAADAAHDERVRRDRDALAAAEDDLAARREAFGRFRDELIATRERFVPIVEAAMEFTRAAAGMRPQDIVPAARPAVAAAHRVAEACRLARSPAQSPPPAPQIVVGAQLA